MTNGLRSHAGAAAEKLPWGMRLRLARRSAATHVAGKRVGYVWALLVENRPPRAHPGFRSIETTRTERSVVMALLPILARLLAVAFVLVAAWTFATAALEAIDAASRQAQAEVDVRAPEASGTAFNPKGVSVDKAVPWS